MFHVPGVRFSRFSRTGSDFLLNSCPLTPAVSEGETTPPPTLVRWDEALTSRWDDDSFSGYILPPVLVRQDAVQTVRDNKRGLPPANIGLLVRQDEVQTVEHDEYIPRDTLLSSYTRPVVPSEEQQSTAGPGDDVTVTSTSAKMTGNLGRRLTQHLQSPLVHAEEIIGVVDGGGVHWFYKVTKRHNITKRHALSVKNKLIIIIVLLYNDQVTSVQSDLFIRPTPLTDDKELR